MKRYLPISALFAALLSVALAGAEAPQAPPLVIAQAPPVQAAYCDCSTTGVCYCGVCTCPGGFTRVAARAAKEGKPFLVWVGAKGVFVTGCLGVSVPAGSYAQYPIHCCLICDSQGHRLATLGPLADPTEISNVLSPPVQAVPMQFAAPQYFAPVQFGGGRRGGGC